MYFNTKENFLIYSMKVTELSKACKRFDYLCSEEKVLCKLLQEKEAKPPSDVYLAAKDRQVTT